MLVLLGISLGSLVSRQLLQHVGAYPLTIALLALATFCSTFGSSVYLQRIHGWDQTSAFLAGSPGALSQITILAAEKGADVPAIAVVQTMRVIILTAALPMLLALTGHRARRRRRPRRSAIASPLELAELVAASVAVALLLRLDQISGELDVRRDDRLERAAWRRAGRGRPAAMAARHRAGRHRRADRRAVRADEGQDPAQPRQCRRWDRSRSRSLISAVFVAVIALTTHVRFSDVVVAFAPGAMDAMLALALTLHIDPIFVGAHHLSRFVFVTIATPGIVHLFGRPQDDVDD